jgi:hypothetical protein
MSIEYNGSESWFLAGLGVDIILADGSLITANAVDHPDLFWAVRGGGGKPVRNVVGGPMFWDLSDAAGVLE